MYLRGKPSTYENLPVALQRAGLRIAPAPGEPTGLFEVIEMAVLVIVTALALVSIIVASSEDESRQRLRPTNESAEQRVAARDQGSRDGDPGSAPTRVRRPSADTGSR